MLWIEYIDLANCIKSEISKAQKKKTALSDEDEEGNVADGFEFDQLELACQRLMASRAKQPTMSKKPLVKKREIKNACDMLSNEEAAMLAKFSSAAKS